MLSSPSLFTIISSVLSRHQNSIRTLLRYPRNKHAAVRGKLAVTAFAAMATQQPHHHRAVTDLTNKLDELAPRFELSAGAITVLHSPDEFYSTLRNKILSAKKRIFLSSLYIGKEEQELVPVHTSHSV